MNTFNTESKTTDLNDTDLELVSGGATRSVIPCIGCGSPPAALLPVRR